MKKIPYFHEWIRQFNDLELAIGDLARDIESDHYTFPITHEYGIIHCYLNLEKKASYNAVRTFEKAWNDYQLFILEKYLDKTSNISKSSNIINNNP